MEGITQQNNKKISKKKKKIWFKFHLMPKQNTYH
jgi:hypothetical protein